MMRFFAVTAAMTVLGVAAWAENHAEEATEDAAEVEATEMALTEENVDLEAAEKIYDRVCRACHGNKAQGVASYPKLADKEPEYIAEKLEIYRSGEKIGPNSVLMIQNAKKLSDEDIAGLAVYVTTAFE